MSTPVPVAALRHPSRALVRALAAVTIVLAAIASLAAEPAAPAAPAVVVDQPAAVAPAAHRPLTAEEQALQAILANGETRVAALLAEGAADPARMDEIQREIGRVKVDINVRFLLAKAEFARRGGDEAGLREAQQALEMQLHPPAPESDARGNDAAKGREVAK